MNVHCALLAMVTTAISKQAFLSRFGSSDARCDLGIPLFRYHFTQL